MVRVLCIIPLALAAVSAVSGHVIRRQQKSAPSGWETTILQSYDAYHTRYLEWGCQKQHNTTFFAKCCHPLLKGEPMSAIENLGCGCDDGDSSVPPSSSTPTPSSPPQAAPSSSPKPADAALAKGDETPTPTPSSSPPPASTPAESSTSPPPPASTPAKSSTSPPPAQTSGSGSGNGAGVNTGGQATFFTQGGNAGACGIVHSDSDFICAMDSALYNQSLCGKKVHITNTANGKTVTVTVADECPTCENPNSIDLSIAAFDTIGDPSTGVLPIVWEYVN